MQFQLVMLSMEQFLFVHKDAKAAVEVLQKNNVNIIGTLLTQVENDGANSGYYYYYYY